MPLILSAFQSSGQDYYDKRTGCIKWLNELTEFYNQLLQVELQQIQHLFHNITIFFADNYGIMNEILESPQSYGNCVNYLQKVNHDFHNACNGKL